jgi:hypothetical protein
MVTTKNSNGGNEIFMYVGMSSYKTSATLIDFRQIEKLLTNLLKLSSKEIHDKSSGWKSMCSMHRKTK